MRTFNFSLYLICILSLAPLLAYSEDSIPPPLQEPIEELTLSQALALTLERNPSLTPYEWDVRAAEARALQAGLRPNPELSLELEDVRLGGGGNISSESNTVGLSPTDGFGVGISRSGESMQGSALGDAQITLALSQLVELGGKRVKRVEAANLEREVKFWDYEVARADVLTQTARAFYGVIAAQEHVQLAEHLYELAMQAHQTIQTLVQAGKVSAIEESRSQVELSRLSIELETAKRELNASRIDLAGQWASNTPKFSKAVGTFPETFAPPLPDTLKSLIAQSPFVARWVTELEMRDAIVLLEQANAKPDLTVNLGIRSSGTSGISERAWDLSSTDGYSISRGSTDSSREARVVLGFSVPLPFFNRNQGLIKEAEYLADKAVDEKKAAEAAITNALSAGYERASASHTEYQTLKTTVIPTAQQTFDAVQEGYRAGKFSLLDVLFAQRALFDAQRQLAQSQASFQQSIVEIERFTGMPVEPVHQLEATAPVEENK